MKIGVIIQGPLVTYGDGPNNVPTGFSAVHAIKENCKILWKLNIDHVVSTWEPTNKTERSSQKELLDAGIPVLINVQPSIRDPYNAYKQHLSILYGFKHLLHLKCLYIVKIRTDMVLPETFWKYIQELRDADKRKLLVSELYRNHPFYLGDFVIAGNIKILSQYVLSILSARDRIYFPLSAFDDGIKFLKSLGYISYNAALPTWLYTYYLVVFKNKCIQGIWNTFLVKNITVMPFSIWKDIIWRDKQICTVVSPTNFLFQAVPQYAVTSSFYNFILLTNSYIRLINKIQKDARTKAYPTTNVVFLISSVANGYVQKIGQLFKRKIILGRFACIGRDVLQLKVNIRKYRIINQQKMRVDLFLDQLLSPKRKVLHQLVEFVPRRDVYPLLEEQDDLKWLATNGEIEYLLMDSFSELTDKKFKHRAHNWWFVSHYSDIDHTTAFDSQFSCEDVLSIDEFLPYYRSFFTWFQNFYPLKKVIFIHTPTTLDSRMLYKKRAEAILSAMQTIEKEMPFIVNIVLSDAEVSHNASDNFPYHFSTNTYYSFLKKWNTMEK